MQSEIGKVLEGKVTGITKFGAFVDIGDGKSGMVHISEVSSTFVNNVSDYLHEGQIVKVKIVNITDDGKIALSMKQIEMHNPKMQSSPKVIENKSEEKINNFEDMLAKFIQVSDERMSDLKKVTESKRGAGVFKRGSRSVRQR